MALLVGRGQAGASSSSLCWAWPSEASMAVASARSGKVEQGPIALFMSQPTPLFAVRFPGPFPAPLQQRMLIATHLLGYSTAAAAHDLNTDCASSTWCVCFKELGAAPTPRFGQAMSPVADTPAPPNNAGTNVLKMAGDSQDRESLLKLAGKASEAEATRYGPH
uniref:Uncharacterized protein n=1 Tax=Sphaerodactylus townsendi TaxID=933632 RepID=A0ACB8GCV0_9SAUR